MHKMHFVEPETSKVLAGYLSKGGGFLKPTICCVNAFIQELKMNILKRQHLAACKHGKGQEMKTKITLSFLILLLFLIVNGKNLYAQKLTIEVLNSTGMDLDSVQLDSLFIGKLPSDSMVLVQNCSAFKASGSWPLMRIRAIDNKGNKAHNLAECGTKANVIKDGRHRIDIKVANPEFGNILTLMLCD